MSINTSIYEFLNDYPELQDQYLYYKSFIISSKDIKSQYDKAIINGEKYIIDIEVYYTANYLYDIDPENSIFKIINQQKDKKYYFLKEHIFYYKFLLKCLNDKKNKNKVDELNINEIFYRTLLNRLYILQSNPSPNLNYGIGKIYNAVCIYTIIESSVFNQIINMKKFSFELLSMKENEVLKLFGKNNEIDKQSFLYNKLLNSISASNSSNDENMIEIDTDIYKAEKIEKNLLDISSELFLFNYLTKQFNKKDLIQIPRLIFFPSIYNKKCEDIYESISKGENFKKCQLLDFCGVLEIDGAFKYIGEKKELNCESFVIILSECLNGPNKIKEYKEYNTKIQVIYKWNKFKKSNIDKLENQFKKYNLLKKEEFTEENLKKIIKKYEEDIKNKINLNKELIINKNDLLLIENKREFPGDLSREINNFIDNSFYFINLYNYLNLLDKSSEIHLIFVYDHNRNHSDEQKSYNDINNYLDKNQIKLSKLSNKIKFYVIHSLPNLEVSILDKLENNIDELKDVIHQQNLKIGELSMKINNLENTVENEKQNINDLKTKNQFLNNLVDIQRKNIDNLNKNNKDEISKNNNELNNLIEKQNLMITKLTKEKNDLNDILINQTLIIKELTSNLNKLKSEFDEMKSKNNK